MPVDPTRARDVFLSAAEVPGPERGAYLDRACGPDAELRAAVERLLAAHADPASLLDPARPPLPLTDPHTPQPDAGTILVGRYKLLEQIGEGGMGAVWVAQQTEPVKRMVAIKLIKPGMDSRTVLARFEAERQALALMDHPNIARVLDAGAVADGRPFFVMELVKGTPITEFCDARRLDPRQRLELFVPVCQAIQHAHQKGIIHRDIKPSNVLVALYDDRAVPKVIDFGVAKATGQPLTEQTFHTGFGAVIGTPQYMSPEQATFNNLDVDTRSDLYSLGVLLYELLAGSPPFTKKDLERAGMLEMLRVVREVEPPRPSAKLSTADTLPTLAANRSTEPKRLTGMLRNELDWIVMKALEKDRTRRYETANGFAADVLRYLSGEPVQAVPPRLSYRLRKFIRKHKRPVTVAAVVLLALLAGIAGTTLGLIRADAARDAESDQRKLAEAETIRANSEAARASEKAAKAQASAEAENRAVRKAHRLLGLMNATDGLKLADEGKLHLGLLRMVQSLVVAAESPEAVAMARTQFALYRKYAPATPGLRAVLPEQKPLAVFSPDGRYVLTGAADGAVRVWNLNTGQSLATAAKHAGPVFAVAFSPDGRRILTGSFDNTARVWDAHSGEGIGKVLQHAGMVGHVAFSPDGQRVLTGAGDGLRVWEADTGDPVTKLLPYEGGGLWSVAFAPDGLTFLTGGNHKTAQLRDARTGEKLLTIPHPDQVNVAVFSPDGRRILTGCEDKSARIWDANSGKQIGEDLRHDGPVNHVAFSPDGRRVLTGSLDTTARIWDANTGQPVSPPLRHAGYVNGVAFSPDGRRVLTASLDKTARVWDANTGKPVSLPLQHAFNVWSASFSSDGRRVLTGSDVARVWDFAATNGTPAPVIRYDQPRNYEFLHPMVFSPDRRRLFTGGWMGAQIWDVETERAVTREPLRHLGHVSAAAFSGDGRRVATGSDDKTTRIWEVETGRLLVGPLPDEWGIGSLDFSPDGRRVVSGVPKKVRVRDATTGAPVYPPLEGGGVGRTCAFSPDSHLIITCGDGKVAVIWDAETGKAVTRLLDPGTGLSDGIDSVAFSPDGRRVVTAGGHTARIWSVETGTEIVPPMRHEWFVEIAAFSPDGTRVITTCWDYTARVWDANTGTPLAPPLQHANTIKWLSFSPDGRQVLTGSWDATARLWDADTGTPLSPPLPHTDRLRCVAFTPDGRRALTGCTPGSISKWDVAPDPRPTADIIGLAQLWSGHRCDETGAFAALTPEELFGLWKDLKSRYPEEFTVRPAAVRKWREGEIRDSMREGDVRAAQFHYWGLAADLASGAAQ